MPLAAPEPSEGLVNELVRLRDEFVEYSELSEKELVTMRKVAEWIRALQHVVSEPIPLNTDNLTKMFPKVKEAYLVKDGVVEIKDRRGKKRSVQLEQFTPQVFLSVVQDSEAKLSRIIAERYSQRAKLRELLRMDFVAEMVPIYDKEIAYFLMVNRSDKDSIHVALAVRKEGDWAIYKRLKLAARQETTVYVTALKVLESPLPMKFEVRCRDAKGNDYRATFNIGPIPPHSEKLSQPIIAD